MVNRKILKEEYLKSLILGHPTDELISNISLLIEKVSTKWFFKFKEDMEDGKGEAMYRMLLYWNTPDKDRDILPYYYQIISNSFKAFYIYKVYPHRKEKNICIKNLEI